MTCPFVALSQSSYFSAKTKSSPLAANRTAKRAVESKIGFDTIPCVTDIITCKHQMQTFHFILRV